jgi:hypothetical protein
MKVRFSGRQIVHIGLQGYELPEAERRPGDQGEATTAVVMAKGSDADRGRA